MLRNYGLKQKHGIPVDTTEHRERWGLPAGFGGAAQRIGRARAPAAGRGPDHHGPPDPGDPTTMARRTQGIRPA